MLRNIFCSLFLHVFKEVLGRSLYWLQGSFSKGHSTPFVLASSFPGFVFYFLTFLTFFTIAKVLEGLLILPLREKP